MKNIIKIAVRNLFRYTRRTILTTTLIALGVTLVIVFSGLAGAFKSAMVGLITDSMLSHIQVHKSGYVESIDNIPLNIFLSQDEMKTLNSRLKKNEGIAAYSPRIKFGAMISNYVQTSNIRLSAVYPEKEVKTCPALIDRIDGVTDSVNFVRPGEIIVPDILLKGLNLKVGNDVVIVATNRHGSVNGISLKIIGVSEGVMGPQGKDGFIHIEDAKTLLRMDEAEISEVAIRLKNFSKIKPVYKQLKGALLKIKDPHGQPIYEVHTWKQLTNFSSITKIIDLLIMMVRVILISIVLISVMNIMMMSVFERTSEIGTIAAIGTSPQKILTLFLMEGFSLGFMSTLVGVIMGIGILLFMKWQTIQFAFGQLDNLILIPNLPLHEILLTSLIVIIVSLFASWQPAWKASRLEPVDALGHV